MTIPITNANFNLILESFGETVTYTREATGSGSTNTRGDITGSASATGSVQAIIQPLTDSDDLVKHGILNVGDVQAYFRSDSGIISYDVITWNSENYRVQEIHIERFGGTSICLEAQLKKIVS